MIPKSHTTKETLKIALKVRKSSFLLTGLALTLHQKTTEWAQKNPAPAACAVAAGGGIAMVVAPGLFSATILNMAGFTGGGVQSGQFYEP